MKQLIQNNTYDEERALYALRSAVVRDCRFAGAADGESVLKECADIDVERCRFSLRYPLWHAKGFRLTDSDMDALTRAPIWYSSNGYVSECRINGIKALRECKSVTLESCEINSPEFGWKCDGLEINDCDVSSEYLLLDSRDVRLSHVNMRGKYSFQYVKGLHISDSVLDTKDAFWHTENAVVENSTVKGEYLGWFSKGLTLINCRIIGTQPLCYCEGLRLIDCTMEATDLSFEYSDVEADIKGNILSVKNPRSGYIRAESIDEVILENSVLDTSCKIYCSETADVNPQAK